MLISTKLTENFVFVRVCVDACLDNVSIKIFSVEKSNGFSNHLVQHIPT